MVLANIGLLLIDSMFIKLLSGTVLFCFLPGFLLVALIFRRSEGLDWLERILLSAGVSYLIAILVFLAAHFLPGEMTLTGPLLALDLLSVILWLPGLGARCLALPKCQAPPREWLYIIILVVLASFFRFASLGYSEYQGDEIDVVSLSYAAIGGQDEVFFLHKKGPAELVTATAFALFTGGFNEGVIRFPFALGSVLAVLATYLLARRAFDPDVAFVAGALLSIEGILLGFSRMVQYHGVVMLMLTLAVYCFYRVYQCSNDLSRYYEEAGLADRYQVLGTLFFVMGLLAHYEAALVGLVLAFLYFRSYGRNFLRRNGIVLLASVGLGLLILLAYYLPFVLHPHFAESWASYTEIRISPDRMPYNNLPALLFSLIFYDSIYYVLFTVIFLCVTIAVGLRQALRRRVVALIVWLLFVAALVGSALFPFLFTIGEVQFNLLLILPVLAVFALAGKIGVERQTFALWFLSYLTVYAFLIRIPGLHYYCLSPAWAVLAALGLSEAGRVVTKPPGLVPAVSGRVYAVALGLVFAFFAFYPYVLFVRTDPEYALSYPQHRLPIYWNTHDDRPIRFFGFPHRSGWKVIGYLYRTGEMQRPYRTNEKKEIATWYTGKEPTRSERPHYYLIAENPTEKVEKQDYPRQVIEEEYGLVGQVFVGGKPRLNIYQFEAEGEDVARYDVEDYEALYERAFAW